MFIGNWIRFQAARPCAPIIIGSDAPVSDLSERPSARRYYDAVDGNGHDRLFGSKSTACAVGTDWLPDARSLGVSGWKLGSRGEVVLLATQVAIVLHCAFEQLIATIVELTTVLT